MSLRRIISPVTPAVGLAEMKMHLRVDHDEEDDLILGYTDAATEWVEHFTRSSLIMQEWMLGLDGFPGSNVVCFPRSPVNDSVVSPRVEYDTDAAQNLVFDPANYDIDSRSIPGRLVTKNGWPEDVSATPESVRIYYATGYGTAPGHVPAPLRQAIMLIVGHWFTNRESVVVGTIAAEVPMAARSLMQSYRTSLIL